VPQDKVVRWTNAKHHERVAVQPIQELAPSGQRQILAHRQHVDVTNSAMIEVSRVRMMDSVRASPKVIGCQSQHADHATNPVVHDALAEKRAMAAIVLDHEEAHEKAGRWHGKQ